MLQSQQDEENHTGERLNRKRTNAFLGCVVGAGLLLIGLLTGRETTRGASIPRNLSTHFGQESTRQTLRETTGSSTERHLENSVPAELHWSSDTSYDWKPTGIDRDITVAQASPDRPVEGSNMKVYTWYVERPKNIKDRDDELIASWKSLWRAYGYDPYVLGLEDAQSNPDFLDFDQSLDAVLNPQYPRDAARRPCYLRYLAMAMQDGGMMVDLDTAPANIAAMIQEKNSPEKFTLYCQVDSPPEVGSQDWPRQLGRQSGLPCAAAGTAAEWMRAAKLAVWTMQYTITFGGTSWTDMHSLGRLSTWNEIDLVQEQRVRSAKPKSWDTCMFRTV